ncbi:SRPBCC domain-containing protein [Sphingopyxis sp. OPL5]|uniref:SRPBCC domain-containing protein n=1 Tax=Sphingopyxis sp. OPL5 TaxID=2486273 RepID=UPI00164DEE0D|nr:SRPBCC domain-containing protein [Sphingopyxis sp. OPL5]QNO27264.1 SRPBCC domain-containing protein [Sphingopyxis sp. OPL5]
MATAPDNLRIDTASRTILAAQRAIFRAMTDAESVASWRPPKGMHARIESFDPRTGGGYRMAFIYEDPAPDVVGKSSAREDWFTGRFVELLPYDRIVEDVMFVSDDPAFAGTMRVTTTLTPVADGTRVTIACENVPPGIGAEDHQAGMASTLRNLAAFIE